MYQFKKGTAAILAGVLSVSSVVPAFAYDLGDTANCDHVTTAGGVGNAAVMLTVEDKEQPVIFSAYVPAELPIAIDANGDVTVPQNAKIINGVESLPIEVEAIDVTMDNGWELTSMDTDMSLEAKDTKKVSMELNGQDMANSDKALPWKIEADSDLPLNMKANLPDQSASSQTKIATIGFTVNWWEDESTIPEVPELNATNLVSASRMRSVLHDLTGSIVFSTEMYDPEQHAGTATDISEAQDRSVMAVVNGQDAVVYSKGGTLAPEDCSWLFSQNTGLGNGYKASSIDFAGFDTKNVTNMGSMFQGCPNLTNLDVSNFDTSKVTKMNALFHRCYALQSVNVSNFNTSNVTDMGHMFGYDPYLTELDLSSFDLTKVSSVYMMFENDSKISTIHCRTDADAAKMKGSSSCPSGINFVVKQ